MSFLPVLAYQKIGRAPKNSHIKNEWTSSLQLGKTLAWLVKHGYTFLTPADLPAKQSAKPILLVFIGGYQTFYTDVFPLLQKYQACATLCVALDSIGAYNSWQDPNQEPWQNIITEKQLKEMHKSGFVQVGLLGLDGKDLLTVPPAQARKELTEAIYRLQMLYKVNACAVAYWPHSKNTNNLATVTEQLHLPVITPRKGKNALTETKFLRILPPGILTKFFLLRNK